MNFLICAKKGCNKIATWLYAPSDWGMCDKHIRRGCSCTDDPNEPCCEYWYDKDGWDIDE